MVFPVGYDKVGTCPEIRYNDVYVVSTNLLKMISASVRLTEREVKWVKDGET